MLDIKDIEMVECPKCHKKHFMKTGTGNNWDVFGHFSFNDCVFRFPPKEIYLNGELQNPEAFVPAPTKVHFECLECGCHFSVKTTYIWTGETTTSETEIIDEDSEKEKREAAWKAEQEKREAELKKAKAEQPTQINDLHSNTVTLTNALDSSNAITTLKDEIINSCGSGTVSEIDLGGFIIKSNKKFTEDQIKNIEETFGFNVKNNKE